MLVRETEEQARIISEYEHRTVLNFTVQFISKRSVMMNATYSAKKDGTYQ
jgi:hypothetical protein